MKTIPDILEQPLKWLVENCNLRNSFWNTIYDSIPESVWVSHVLMMLTEAMGQHRSDFFRHILNMPVKNINSITLFKAMGLLDTDEQVKTEFKSDDFGTSYAEHLNRHNAL